MPRRDQRYRIEDCRILDVAELLREVIVDRMAIVEHGSVYWTDGQRIGFSRPASHKQFPCLVLSYGVIFEYTSQVIKIEQLVPIVANRQRLGGVRYRGRCPITPEHHYAPCHKLVDHLYLPPDQVEFGCRSCHRLIYRNRHRARTEYRETMEIADAVGLWAQTKRQLKEDIFPDVFKNIAPVKWDPNRTAPAGFASF